MANENNHPFSYKGFGLGLGCTWGVVILVTGWLSCFGWGNLFVDTMASLYVGYDSTFFGSVRGAIWGFVDGAIIGLIFTFFHNYFICKKSARRRRK